MSKENNKNWKPDVLLKAGLIVNIVISSISLVTIWFNSYINSNAIKLILFVISIASVIISSLVLSRKIENKILAGVFGLFSSIIGGILILCGKVEIIEETNDNVVDETTQPIDVIDIVEQN